MYVIIVGAGEVGRTIAGTLESEHEVAVVDVDTAIIKAVERQHDILTVNGDGTERATLQEAGIERADMIIAATDNDEANIVTCGTAKAQADVFTIARVKRRDLLETWRESNRAYGVDFMICTDLLAAEAVFRLAGVPGALDVDTFVGGLVRMAKLQIPPESAIAGRTVAEADQYEGLTFAALFRGETVIIPTGETELRPHDRIIVIGDSQQLWSLVDELSDGAIKETDDVVVVGGTEVGFQTARLFADRGYQTRLIERNPERARTIAEELPKVTVLEQDATDVAFLRREHVQDTNLFISALSSDEKNLLVSLLASQVGTDQTVAIVNRIEYGSLFETVGVDAAVSPREETAEEIIRVTRNGEAEKIAMTEADSEVIEIEVTEDSLLAERTIADAASELPEQFVVGAIARQGQLVTPRGETVITAGDRIVIFVRTDRINKLLEKI